MISSKYTFDAAEKIEIRKQLLSWYNEKKRILPWRRKQTEFSNQNDYAYAVWVSEIMLQQTKVATVIEYYNRWMLKWPTVSCLAKASQEEVNMMWSGLGYYSRGRRLFEGACKVVNDLNGNVPTNSVSLLKQLPGVGRYTAAAIASIVFGEPVGVLDGNVIRVLCRMRAIGGNTANKEVNQHLWSLSNDVVDPDNPGDFNQALMELGATVCTPKNPVCSSCPVKSCCKAYSEAKDLGQEQKLKLVSVNKSKFNKENCGNTAEVKQELVDVEDCVDFLALPFYNYQLGVENYPQKLMKRPPRNEFAIVVLIELENEAASVQNNPKFLMSKRPKSGLLADLWEFPNKVVTNLNLQEPSKKRKLSKVCSRPSIVDRQSGIAEEIVCKVLEKANISSSTIRQCKYIGEYIHKFSHIHQTNLIYHIKITACLSTSCISADEQLQWVSQTEFLDLPKPTLVVNVFKLFHNSRSDKKVHNKIVKGNATKQANIKSFFTKKEVSQKILH